MSLFTFPIESALLDIADVSSSDSYVNASMLETSQLLPSLQGFNTNLPTPEEIEHLSFFDEWLANDCNGVLATPSSDKFVTPLDDFEITPINDVFDTPSFDLYNSALIDDSVLSAFPSPECVSHMSFLSELSTDSAHDPYTTLSYVNYSMPQESPVNIQLPSPAQTPRTSPMFSKLNLRESCSTVATAVTSNKRASDEVDSAVMKRQKNTDAARRSRQRKVERISQLDKRTTELLAENTKLNTKVAILESEKKHQRQKELELQIRIQTLENQLAEAHRILTDR
ncbi:hypothetical protein K493DRAFT_313570 [Basidiobolus meristosporus CBS 931.73]|uniref:BZIP domain-containing protein n=1 Tax=Basidiobolus meristosporus CBS 931.73 TaxID=1314790 RepID=A0A1Y1YKY5_9FUNG|nr:hypothetical protein K493DRAFT_313570 [Basidiobolus meristosporus CBS 931.73]|eukprot:ORX98642.1 hypothetical protein K493DRAFT_313570 [Basidiobolus meristosporus CBS 931.73]